MDGIQASVEEGLATTGGVQEGEGVPSEDEILGADGEAGGWDRDQNDRYHSEHYIYCFVPADQFKLLLDGECVLVISLPDDGLLVIDVCLVVVESVQELLGFN